MDGRETEKERDGEKVTKRVSDRSSHRLSLVGQVTNGLRAACALHRRLCFSSLSHSLSLLADGESRADLAPVIALMNALLPVPHVVLPEE